MSFFTPVEIQITNPPVVLESKAAPPLYIFEEVEFLPYEPEQPPKEEFDIRCYCVMWLRFTYGVPVHGDSNTLVPNTSPQVGAILLTKWEKTIHAEYIVSLGSDGMVVHGSNLEPCKETRRVVAYNDSRIKGFYLPN